LKNRTFKIVILGPESTGKTLLAKYLAKYYKTKYLPEYARFYVEKLDRKYNYKDVVFIYKKQLKLEKKLITQNNQSYVFIDTDLIITKVWFEVVYKKMPLKINDDIKKNIADLYLLCYPDLEWIYDPVRENAGEMRNILFAKYETELKYYNCKYHIINGFGKQRFINAINVIDSFFG